MNQPKKIEEFLVKETNEETLGQRLRQTRELEHISLEKLAAITKIQIRYLRALESGDHGKLPADVYVKGILGQYSDFFNLNKQEILRAYQLESENYLKEVQAKELINWRTVRQAGKDDSLPENRFLERSKFLLTPKMISSVVGGILICAFVVYLIHQLNFLVGLPSLSLENPKTDAVTSEKKMKIQGRTDLEANLTINGKPVALNNGLFSQEIELKEGLNVFEIKAGNRFNKYSTIIRRIIYESKKDSAATTSIVN